MDVTGHAALVTGGGSGMGAETARALAAAGARVAVLDVNMDGASEVAAETGGIALECDVADGPSGEAAVAAAREAHGPARILINCAGVGTPGRIVSRAGPLPLEDYVRVVNINLVGTFNLMRLAAADMTGLDPVNASGERGVIINTASVAAYDGQVGQPAYASSKGGVVALTLPLPASSPSSGCGSSPSPRVSSRPRCSARSRPRSRRASATRSRSRGGSPAPTSSHGSSCTSSTTRS